MPDAPDLRPLTHARDLVGGAIPGPEADQIAGQLVDLNAGEVTIDNRDTGEQIDYFLLKGKVACRVEASVMTLPPGPKAPIGTLFHQVEITQVDGQSTLLGPES